MENTLAILEHDGKQVSVGAATKAWMEWLRHGSQEWVDAKEFESRLGVRGRCGNGFG